jgi:hypothetical protein
MPRPSQQLQDQISQTLRQASNLVPKVLILLRRKQEPDPYTLLLRSQLRERMQENHQQLRQVASRYLPEAELLQTLPTNPEFAIRESLRRSQDDGD